MDSVERSLNQFTDQLKKLRQENDINEVDLKNLQQTFTQLDRELDQIPGISIEHQSTSFIDQILVKVLSGECMRKIRKYSE